MWKEQKKIKQLRQISKSHIDCLSFNRIFVQHTFRHLSWNILCIWEKKEPIVSHFQISKLFRDNWPVLIDD